MFNENIKVTGDLIIYKFDGEVQWDNLDLAKSKLELKNLVVTTGRNFIAARLGSSPPTQMTHMAIGAPSTINAPLPTDTTLTTEIARVALTVAGGTSSGSTVTYVCSFGAGVGTSTTITEAGIFSASSGGTMLSRTTFAAVNKGAGESIAIVWVINING